MTYWVYVLCILDMGNQAFMSKFQWSHNIWPPFSTLLSIYMSRMMIPFFVVEICQQWNWRGKVHACIWRSFLPEVKFADLWKPEFACAALFIWENKRLEFDKREANQNLFVWSRVWAFWSFGWLHGSLWIISNQFDEVFCLKWNLLIMKAGVWLRSFIFIKANENNLSRVWS